MIRPASWWRSALGAVAMLSAATVCACGASSFHSPSALLTRLDACLQRQGIPHGRSPDASELAIPGLQGLDGPSVPPGVSPARYQAALARCGAGAVHVGSAPIEAPALRERIARLAACLDRNGYQLPSPDYSGEGQVLDTSRIDVDSARWIATVKGCRIDDRLTQAQLRACLGGGALEGAARTNPALLERIVELGPCLRR